MTVYDCVWLYVCMCVRTRVNLPLTNMPDFHCFCHEATKSHYIKEPLLKQHILTREVYGVGKVMLSEEVFAKILK